jgi:nucleotide-binding universal stress UspA family protein
MYKHIMLPVEGDEELSAKAVNECFLFAKSVGAKVTLLHVVPHANISVPVGFTSGIVSQIRKQHEDEDVSKGRKMLLDVVAGARTAGVDCDDMVVVGDSPYEEIIDSAEKNHCDLIMMASHARRGLDAMMFGSETVRVLKHTKIPVLVVR